jgi:hypothetical protein
MILTQKHLSRRSLLRGFGTASRFTGARRHVARPGLGR